VIVCLRFRLNMVENEAEAHLHGKKKKGFNRYELLNECTINEDKVLQKGRQKQVK
jgi:hypothetical protein